VSPETPTPEIVPLPEQPPVGMPTEAPLEPVPVESFPFWGYLDLAAFVGIAIFGLMVDALLVSGIVSLTHVKPIYVEVPAQFLLYAFMLSMLAVLFRRYYGRPFWESIRWTPPGMGVGLIAGLGVLMAFAVIAASALLQTPDINSPMKQLLSDKTSMLLVGAIGITLAPLCEELIFRGFAQPLLIRSLGVAPGILATAVPFGLLHLPEYGYSWRHGLLIAGAGAAFGWMRHRTGSTKAAVIMHSAYNCVFFLLLAAEQAAPHPR
jgi:membrane protease YdiL (CAAX protease family)